MHSKFRLAANSCFSGSHQGNSCMKLLTLTHFRYDPYNAAVIPAEYMTQSPVRADHHQSSLPSAYYASSPVAASVSPTNHAPYDVTPMAMSFTEGQTHYQSSTATMPPPLMTVTLPETGVLPSVYIPVSAPLYASTGSSSSCASSCAGSVGASTAVSALSISPAPSIHGFRYAVIKFKQETATFIAPFRTVVGETVVVEGDRGENIGVVQEISQAAPSFDVKSRILRKATDKDLAALSAQREREASAQQFTQTVASNLGLHATIEDVEYQFDLNKLTIFVRRSTKGGFVDFRKLQRSLFREFRCRIWCSYMDEVEAVENGPRCR
jgi:hypothetical protein